MTNPFGVSVVSPFSQRQAFVSRTMGNIGEAHWANFQPAYAYGQINLTSGSTGSVSTLTASSAPNYLTSIVQTGGGGALSTGTCTFTFGGVCRAYYAVHALIAVNSLSSYTGATTMRHQFVATVNVFSNGGGSDTRSVNAVVNDNSLYSFRLIQCTGAGQTFVIGSTASAPNSGIATLYVNYLIYPLAWI